MNKSYWREISKPIIAEVLSRGLDPKKQKRALRKVYPFGERARYPYKIWLDEIKRQTGAKPPLGSHLKKEVVDPDQQKLEL